MTHPSSGPAARVAGPARWVAGTLATLLAASFVVFAMQALVPGDPARTVLTLEGGPPPTPASIAAKRRELHLDAPLVVRYVDWLSGAVHGDFGRSWTQAADVTDLLGPRVATTAQLAGAALVVALVLTLLVGLLSALRPGGVLDHAARLTSVVVIAVPSFVLGLLVLQFVVLDLGIGRVMAQPGSAAGILPALLLGVVLAAGWIRPFRALMLDAASAPTIRVARARGVGRLQALSRIALPAAFLDFLPYVGLALGGLLGGTMLIEVVFSWPGAAAYAVEAANRRDLPVVQAFTLLSVVAFRIGVDLVRGARWAIDPRVRRPAVIERGRT